MESQQHSSSVEYGSEDEYEVSQSSIINMPLYSKVSDLLLEWYVSGEASTED